MIIMTSDRDALASIEQLLQSNPSDATAWNIKGVLLARMNDFGTALRAFDTAIRLNPELAEAHTNRGRVLLALGANRAEESLRSFNRALELSPGNPEALRDKAVALHALGRSAEELDCVRTLSEQISDEPSIWLRRGDLETELGKFEDAVRSFDRALQIDPHLVAALMHRAIALAMVERWKDAIKSAEAATEIAPDSIEAWRVLADVEIRAERHKQAMRALERAAKLAPDDASIYNTMGMVSYKAGHPHEAIKHFRRATTIDRRHISALKNLGIIYMELEQWSEAAQVLSRLTSFYTQDPEIWDIQAVAYARLKDFCAAAKAWENARRLYRKRGDDKEGERVQALGRAARINCSRQKKAWREKREQERATTSFSDRFELRRRKQRE